MEAILDFWRDDVANDFNGKVVAQKKLRLDSGAYGRDFTIEGRPNPKEGLATIRVREYLSAKVLYILVAATAADQELPDDVGHYFASFSPGTKRTKKVGPHPEPDGKPLGDWGMAIDPDNDCKIDDKGSALEISIPNTHHDLNADNNKLNAPRVVREVTGDFSITVKVTGGFKPSAKSTNPKAVPYIGGGIVIWQDSNNYIFLGRAAINRGGKIGEFAAFEEREWGTRRRAQQPRDRSRRGLPPRRAPQQPHPRLHQQGRQELDEARPHGAQLPLHIEGRPLRDQRLQRPDRSRIRGLQLHRRQARRQGQDQSQSQSQDQEPLRRAGGDSVPSCLG